MNVFIILIIIVALVFLIWLEWWLGKLIGKNVSRTTGIIVGILLILVGFGLVMGIACIVYSQNNANAPVNLNANVNMQPTMQPPSPQSVGLEKLEKAKQLHDQGLLSKEEYEAFKKKSLGI